MEQNEVRSSVEIAGGVPMLFVNGRPFAAAAYMTYLEEYNDYAAFADAGYRLFSVPVLCAGRWINAAVEGRPFHRGVFDEKGAPDYSHLDASVRRILSVCPEAYIFPRLNLAAPKWWIAERPGDLDGTRRRESLFSPAYRMLAEEMLRGVIRHVEKSDYAGHIVGYQLAGGNTEEWFHFNLNGGCCESAQIAFHVYLQTHAPAFAGAGMPDLSLLQSPGPYHGSGLMRLYLEFASRAVAELIGSLCAAAKRETGGRLAVGTFYGYSLEVSSPLWGTHALKALLESESVDFICSPNSYINTRAPHADWTEMYPAASVRAHGKLCMQECDIRTHLTRPLWQSAPEHDPEKRYTAPIWQGLPRREDAVQMLRKTFCRQLIAGNGFWWFDMWGGWYRDPVLLAELERMRSIYETSLALPARGSIASFAVFIDESAYAYFTDCPLRGAPFGQREPLGLTGAPYDLFDVFDFGDVYRRYKAVLFLCAAETPAAASAKALCRETGLPYLSLSEENLRFSAPALRAFLETAGVHIYCKTDDLLYVNRHFLAVHACAAGEKTVILPHPRAYRALLPENGPAGAGDTIRLFMRENETLLFRLTDA